MIYYHLKKFFGTKLAFNISYKNRHKFKWLLGIKFGTENHCRLI